MRTDRFTQRATEAIVAAQQLAEGEGHPQLEVAHVLLVLAEQPDGVVPAVLDRVGAGPASVAQALRAELAKLPKVSGAAQQLQLSNEARRVLTDAHAVAERMRDEYVSTEHLLLAAIEAGDSTAARIMAEAGVAPAAVLEALTQIRGNQRVTNENPEATYQALEKYGRDLTDAARKGKLDPVIGRDEEIRRVIQVLSRRTKNNPVLIGEPGVGKTAIVEGLAQRIVRGDVPEGLKRQADRGARPRRAVAGAKYRGEFEERLKAVLKEITESDGQIICSSTSCTPSSAPARPRARWTRQPAQADARPRRAARHRRDDARRVPQAHREGRRARAPLPAGHRRPADGRGHDQHPARPPRALRGPPRRAHHRRALVAAAVLSNRYITERFLPDKAIDLVDEAASRLRMEMDSMPAELDEIERRRMQLEIEREALRKEKDDASKARLEALERELADLRERGDAMKAQWEREGEIVGRIREAARGARAAAARDRGGERALRLPARAELQYGRLPRADRSSSPEEEAELRERRRPDRSCSRRRSMPRTTSPRSSRAGPASRSRASGGRAEKLIHMEERLHRRVVGQDEAVPRSRTRSARARAGLKDPRRPIGSFIFLGPTGVGKTELAKALAEFLFDDEQEHGAHRHERVHGEALGLAADRRAARLRRLRGGRPAHRGGAPPALPVILFDEIEKAHPDVFNVLLQILDDGRLTDGQGRTVDFKNTVIIMTSNIGRRAALLTCAPVRGTWRHAERRCDNCAHGGHLPGDELPATALHAQIVATRRRYVG
jgi:ATP-dependent Clp protease ATP-binding subunit ClpB